MAGLQDFSKRMQKIAVEVEGGVEQAMRDCASRVAESVIDDTPVDTGRARSNWIASLDQPDVATLSSRVPGTGGSTAEANSTAAIEAASRTIGSFKLRKNSSIHLTNNLPYIARLDEGSSTQAPRGFVRNAVMSGLRLVRSATLRGR